MKGDFRVVLQGDARDELEICLASCDPSVQKCVGKHLMYVAVVNQVSIGVAFTPTDVVNIFNSSGEVIQLSFESKGVGHIELRLRGCGTLGAYSSLRPQRITRGRVKELKFCYEDSLELLPHDSHISEAEVYEWRRSTIRLGAKQRSCAFDPGGNISPKLFLGNFDVGECVPWLYCIMFGMRGRARELLEILRSFWSLGRILWMFCLNCRGKERYGFVLGDISIKALIWDMIVAGNDETITLIEWTLSELIQHKRAMNEFFFMMDVLTLLQLCASIEHLHAFDPGGSTSPKLMLLTLVVASWFPP